MRHYAEIKQYPVAVTMHPWHWVEKWQLNIEVAAALLGLTRSHSFYRWHPQTKGEKRQPTIQIQVACALYDRIWQQTGCPYS